MTNEIKSIMRYLVERITRLQAAVKALQEIEIENELDEKARVKHRPRAETALVLRKLRQRVAPAPAPAPADPVESARVEKPAAAALAEPKLGIKASRTREILSLVAGLVEPFNSAALVKVLPGDRPNSAYAALFRLQAKGWLRKSAEGLYVRTAKFVAPDGVAAPAAPGDMAKDPLVLKPLKGFKEEERATALRSRDRCRESGNERLAEIHQRKVNELDAELEALGK